MLHKQVFTLFILFGMSWLGAVGISIQGEPDHNPQECVETFDPNINYFPEQVVSDYAVEWDIEYFNHYKVITVTSQEAGGYRRYIPARAVRHTFQS
jgi:iron complex transport system substrate-binding protein